MDQLSLLDESGGKAGGRYGKPCPFACLAPNLQTIRTQASEGGKAPLAVENAEAGERQERLRAIASDLLYWKGGLKVLRQAQLPKWRGNFTWQIAAQIEALQTAYARLRTEAANEGG